ncbi:hypothetical protein [Carboxylicivirga taeanensis]|uniref:hypothetical protein n=1 Tax=Carboxylicivirga taeanensis TaxID=1416875 RepID=UPI003F6E0356
MKNVTSCFGKTFGPVGSFSGVVLFTLGVVFFIMGYLGAIILVLIGAFIAFTKPYTTIDFEQRRVRSGDLLFGVAKTGKWQKIQADMQIGFWHSNKVYRTYSRSNRALDITQEQDLICLFDKRGKKLMNLQRLDNATSKDVELDRLSKLMGIERMG